VQGVQVGSDVTGRQVKKGDFSSIVWRTAHAEQPPRRGQRRK